MNAAAILNSRAVGYAALALVGAVVAYVVVKRLGEAAEKALLNVNEGTPYEGAGVLGTIAHGADAASGNALSTFGYYPERGVYGLGSWLADIFQPSYDPNAPTTRKQQVRTP